jgi:L-asparaginase II
VDRDTTLWMQAVPGLMAKEGAAGMMAGSLDDGRAFAFKIASGSDPVRQAVTPQALRTIGVDVDGGASDTLERVAVPMLGHGREVGRIEPLEWDPCSS